MLTVGHQLINLIFTRYAMPENVKRRAITAGLIGGVLFFIVAIIVSVCTVKICNRRKRRKQEQGNYKQNKHHQ